MDEMNNTVAEAETNATETPADDAQGTEIDVSELMGSLMGGEGKQEETVETAGDDGPGEPEQKAQQETGDKFSRRIAAALKSQERRILDELGGGELTREEIAEIVRAHKARRMHEDDPEISEKAARKIIEAQTQRRTDGTLAGELSQQMREMMGDGWTPEEMQALVEDEAVQADVAGGRTLRQAARAYERRLTEARKKRAVRTARSTASGESPEPDPIKAIPDDRFDAFMDDLRRRAMRGERIRI